MSMRCPGCLRRVDLLKVDSALKDTMDVRNLLLWPCLLLALEGGLELRPRAEAQHSQVPTALASGSQASRRTWEAAEIFLEGEGNTVNSMCTEMIQSQKTWEKNASASLS